MRSVTRSDRHYPEFLGDTIIKPMHFAHALPGSLGFECPRSFHNYSVTAGELPLFAFVLAFVLEIVWMEYTEHFFLSLMGIAVNACRVSHSNPVAHTTCAASSWWADDCSHLPASRARGSDIASTAFTVEDLRPKHACVSAVALQRYVFSFVYTCPAHCLRLVCNQVTLLYGQYWSTPGLDSTGCGQGQEDTSAPPQLAPADRRCDSTFRCALVEEQAAQQSLAQVTKVSRTVGKPRSSWPLAWPPNRTVKSHRALPFPHSTGSPGLPT